jgi:hypothetical protein
MLKMLHCFGNSESLEVLRQSLRDLDKIKVIDPEDLAILDLKRTLEGRIAELEGQQLSINEAVQEVAAD